MIKYYLPSGQSSSATVLSYKSSAIFGRLGVHYVRSHFSKLGCGLVMDFDGDSIANISLNPMLPQQAMVCELKHDGKDIIVLLQ
jgi:hypothetical protein